MTAGDGYRVDTVRSQRLHRKAVPGRSCTGGCQESDWLIYAVKYYTACSDPYNLYPGFGCYVFHDQMDREEWGYTVFIAEYKGQGNL